MKGRKITLAQLRGAEEWFELSVINFHLLCRMGQCDVKFVFERDIQSFSNRWGWEQRWSHFIKEMRVGNCSSKVHTAEVDMFRHYWEEKKKTAISCFGWDDCRAGHWLLCTTVRDKGSRVRNTRIWMQQCSIQSLLLHGSVCICSVPQLTDVKHGVKKAAKVPRGGGRVSHYRCVLWEMLRKEEGYNRPMQAMEPLGSTGMSLFPEPRAPVMPSSQPGPPSGRAAALGCAGQPPDRAAAACAASACLFSLIPRGSISDTAAV